METPKESDPDRPQALPGRASAALPSPSLRRRQRADRLARGVVRAGGAAIVASVLAIFVFIVLEVLPLFASPAAKPRPPIDLARQAVHLAVDETESLGLAVLTEGFVEFYSLDGTKSPGRVGVAAAGGAGIRSAWTPPEGGELWLGTGDGRIVPVAIGFEAIHDESGLRPRIQPRVEEGEPIGIDPEGSPLTAVAASRHERRTAAAAITQDGRLLYVSIEERKALTGGVRRTEARKDLSGALPARATDVALDGRLENLYVGTEAGHIVQFDLLEPTDPRRAGAYAAGDDGAAVTKLGLLIGGQSLVVGTETGSVRVWFQVEDPTAEGGRAFRPVHGFDAHSAPITAIAASGRDRRFVTADAAGRIALHHATSSRTLLELSGSGRPVTRVALAPRATALYAVEEGGAVRRWVLDNPHPEAGWGPLFLPTWYEGYAGPELVWQSTGGTDAFEPKFSLTPLIFGTLKGTVYAMLLAVPLAILGAIFASQFLHPDLRALVKPAVEVMAALPSVVLGFIAGLWLAPAMERVMPALLLMAVVVPASCLGAMGLARGLPAAARRRLEGRGELFLLVPVMIAAVWFCLRLNSPVEQLLFGGDFRQWWFESTGLRHDQRNALVVGIAMGFAVIPIIFTIAEDALSAVPRHLTSGSLALGATRWQTLLRVVLPTASPGIFSAVMIGFGRAVGETMIVLMATGNTPVMEWNPLNGFRTLAANIAVEIPEAPHGSTLYRTLFLGALLLFAVTFAVNTAAEVVRQRMRTRYAKL